ncbi:MAG: hypothetical protein Q9226_002593 [Calogaya cf. arnoldii]
MGAGLQRANSYGVTNKEDFEIAHQSYSSTTLRLDHTLTLPGINSASELYTTACPYRAASDSEFVLETLESRPLTHDGHPLDKITETSKFQPWTPPTFDLPNYFECLKILLQKMIMQINLVHFAGLPNASSYFTGEDMEDVYWKTLAAAQPDQIRGKDDTAKKSGYLILKGNLLKFAYLRRLPSRQFEYMLAATLCLWVIWLLVNPIIRLFVTPVMRRPKKPESHWLVQDMSFNNINRRLIKTKSGKCIKPYM